MVEYIYEERFQLLDEFKKNDDQRLFHLDRFPTKEEIFKFISITTPNPPKGMSQKQKGNIIRESYSDDQIVFSENEKTAPNRIIVLDDLMNEAFNFKENDAMMKLLMTKLSHHNSISVLIVCHELYPKGRNSVLFHEQLTGVHLHSVANTQKAKKYVHSYLSDEQEKQHYDKLFREHVLDINNGLKEIDEEAFSLNSIQWQAVTTG